jgi:hypothetical protein
MSNWHNNPFSCYVHFSGMTRSREISMHIVNVLMKSRSIEIANTEIRYVETLFVPIQITRFRNCYILESNIKHLSFILSTIGLFRYRNSNIPS